jgi:hypothetical protein
MEMKCSECQNRIIDAVGNNWCKIKQHQVAEYLIEKFGCNDYKLKMQGD